MLHKKIFEISVVFIALGLLAACAVPVATPTTQPSQTHLVMPTGPGAEWQ